MSFWVITSFFNPAGYKANVDNYLVFSKNMKRQGVNLFSIEVAFNNDPFYLPDSHKVKSNSVMWLKERLINHAVSLLPDNCDAFAWIDADLLFSQDNWVEQSVDKLSKFDIIQLFKRVFYLPRGHTSYCGEQVLGFQGIVAQRDCHYNWLQRRREKDIPFASPGFAWAARRNAFPNGIYDRDIVGSGDCILVDCLMDTWDLHGHSIKFNDKIKNDIHAWNSKLNKNLKIDYLPVDIFHLWHGRLHDRSYMKRHGITRSNNFDPDKDIRLENGVYEWNSDKTRMHQEMKEYFYNRLEDK